MMPIGMRRRAYRPLHTGGAPSFDQQILALNPTAFFYAGDGDSIPAQMNGATDGGALTTWNDLGVNGYHVTQAGAGTLKPTYDQSNATFNNRGCVTFDGGDYLIKTGLSTAVLDLSKTTLNCMIVYSTTSANAARCLVGEGNSADGLPFIQHGVGSVDATEHRFSTRSATGGNPDITTSTLTINDGNAHLYTLRRISATSWSLRLDGTQAGTSAVNCTAISINQITLGALTTTSTVNQFVGNIACVMVFHSDANYAAIEALLAAHYGITLP